MEQRAISKANVIGTIVAGKREQQPDGSLRFNFEGLIVVTNRLQTRVITADEDRRSVRKNRHTKPKREARRFRQDGTRWRVQNKGGRLNNWHARV
jgi:hypothetical protein